MDTSAQRALVGIICREPDGLSKAMTTGLSASSFLDQNCRRVFEAALLAEREGRSYEGAAIAVEVPELAVFIAQMVADAPLAQNVEYYANAVIDEEWRHRCMQVCNSALLALRAWQTFQPTGGLRALALQAMETIAVGGVPVPGPRPISDVLDKMIPLLEQRIIDYRSGKVSGVSTGLALLDKVAGGGWKPGSLITIGARPGEGKTTLGINALLAAAKAGKASLMFTVEMPAIQMAKKLLSRAAAVNASRIDLGSLTEQDLDTIMAAIRDLNGAPIWIDDSFGGDVNSLSLTAERFRRRGNLDLIVVDYVQQLRIEDRTFSTRQGALTEITHRLKQLSLRLEVPVLMMAQLNREAVGSDSIGLHHLKDSGSIEQDSDMVLVVDPQKDGAAWIRVLKNRHGQTCDFKVKVDFGINLFADVGNGVGAK